MKSVAEIIDEARQIKGCIVEPAVALPSVASPLKVPEDLIEFYSLCGGMDIFPQSDWSWRIVRPEEVVRADPVILKLAYMDNPGDYDGTASEALHILAIAGAGPEYITIDFSQNSAGLCFDSYYGDHASDSCKVIALSFTELLNKLFYWRNEGYFWADAFYGYLGQPTSQLKLRSRLPKRGKLP